MGGTLESFVRVALCDLSGRDAVATDAESHLLAAEAWLCRAHDASPDGGVSYGFSLRGGWRPSYPETSGYIATTFLRLAVDRDPAFAQRARRILDWLLAIQNADGSYPNPRYGSAGIVFDTGQILFGLVRGYEATRDPHLLDAARRAGDWLVRVADAELRWTRNEHLDTPHVYNTRTAWALLRLNQVEFDSGREAVARRNLEWAVSQQRSSGFFDQCAFRAGVAPFTHTIAYATRGLLESAVLLDEPRYLAAARSCAEATVAHLDGEGHLPSTISPGGVSRAGSCCLTGNCQFAIIWARLHALDGDAQWRQASNRALDCVMNHQDVVTADANVRGGIKGSHPVWGAYASMTYPNWAAKFFIDAMWLRKRLEPE